MAVSYFSRVSRLTQLRRFHEDSIDDVSASGDVSVSSTSLVDCLTFYQRGMVGLLLFPVYSDDPSLGRILPSTECNTMIL